MIELSLLAMGNLRPAPRESPQWLINVRSQTPQKEARYNPGTPMTRAYRFGPFELEVSRRRLLRDDEPVALPPKAFDLLLLLVEDRHRLVDKQELMNRLWPDTVVEEANLTQQVFMLRKILGEQANGRPFIDTVPRRGYMFAAEVEEVGDAGADTGRPINEARQSVAQNWKWRWAAAVLLVVAAAAVGGFVTVRMMRRADASRPSPTTVTVRRLTEFLGLEGSPTLSPDGRSFAFTGGSEGTRQLWVRLLAGGKALQLTHDHADHLYPRWTRDSTSLIYFSPSPAPDEPGSLWQIPALGGSSRRLASSLSGADVGPGGELTFFRLNGGIVELVVASGDASQLNVLTQLEPGYNYLTPRWSPDGKFIAYERDYHGLDAIYVVALDEKKPRQLIYGREVNGLAWRPDGSGVVFSSVRESILVYQETYHLWSLDLDATEPRQLTFGEASYMQPDVSGTGEIVAARISLHSDLWRFPVDGDGAANVREATRVTRQTAEVRVPEASPSGDEIAYLSDTGGRSNLWILRTDTGEARQLTFERDPKTLIGVPLWSPDGRRIAYYWRRVNDFGYSMIQSDGTGLRKILTKGWWACWAPDGRWLYYQDVQGPGRRLMKIAADGGSPIVVRNESAGAPALSSDGKTLFFTLEVPRRTGAVDYEIRAASPENGRSRPLVRIGAHRAPDSGRFHPVISPDDRWLALPLFDGTTANIWAVSTSDGTMRRITDFGDRSTYITRRVSWSPDGRSIYAAVSEGAADIVRFDGLFLGK
jgi:Tol biopolymer transport system component/DNA-binding winged helix-turn-helix (wHTH) protein